MPPAWNFFRHVILGVARNIGRGNARNPVFVLISLAAAVPSLGTDDYERLGVLTYNILDRGWSDEGQGPRLIVDDDGNASGPFTNYILSAVSPYNNVVAF